MPLRESLTPSDIEVHPFSKEFDISTFDCGKKNFNEYIQKAAHEDHENNIGKVWLFCHINESMVAGYVTLAMSQLHKTEHKKLGKMTSHGYIPGLLLGQMARDNNYRERNMGEIMIKWVISRAVDLSMRITSRG